MRRSHTVNGVTTNYVYDVGGSLPLVLQDGTNTLVYGLDLISSTDGAGNQTYFSYDGLGSTTDLTDGTGAVTDTYSYDIFGAVRARTGTNASPWKFTGEQEDGAGGDSGYYFLRARYYDPSTGRFISKDPLPFDQRYAYAGGNPVLASDPSGLDCGLGESDNCGGPKYGGGSTGYTGSNRAPAPQPSKKHWDSLHHVRATRGNFGMGAASRATADEMGRTWVGPNYRVASDGRTLVSSDGLRVYRPPAFKEGQGHFQANFEWRSEATGPMLGNGHLDILEYGFRLAE